MFFKTGNSPIIATSEDQTDLSEKKSDEIKEECESIIPNPIVETGTEV